MQTLAKSYIRALQGLLLACLLGVSVPAWALFGCTQTSYNCVSSGCKYIDNTPVCTQGSAGPYGALYVNSPCWQYQGVYTCYTGQQTNSCSSAQLSGCYLSSTTCTKTISDGNCVQWNANYICPGDSSTTCGDNGGNPPSGACQQANVTCNATDNGTCVNQTTTSVCPTETSVPQCNTKGNCTLTSANCTSQEDGVCDTEKQTYTCGFSKQVCTQTATIDQCDKNMTEGLGTPQVQNTNNDFQEAATYMGILNAISKNLTPGNLTIFPGVPSWCVHPVFSNVFTTNCCNENLTKKQAATISFNSCSQNALNLDAARRANRAVYLGQWCNDKALFICLSRKQGYCVFSSVLSKIIQQQGREQLAQLAASGYGGSQSSQLAFNYFSSNGGWGPQITVNGNTVAVWQWPTYCKAVNGQVDLKAEESAEENGGIVCPSLPSVWFAACDNSANQPCGALPSDPRDGGGGPGGWTVQDVDPSQNISSGLTKYTVATGDCDMTNGNCQYQIAAWPSGSGGQATLSMSLGWPLYSPGSSQASASEIEQLGNYEFQPVTLAGSPGASFPATVPLNYSLNSGGSWQQVQLPTNLPLGQATLGTNINIYGSCNPGSFQCQYTVIAPVSVTTMPWGTPQNPQCEGFTTAQLSVLNFNKMNLSEYIQSITPAALNQQALSANTSADAQSFYKTFTSGGSATAPNPQGNEAAVICDNFNASDQCQDESASGAGPFNVALNASTTWPPATGAQGSVTGVSVNWGDGTSSTASNQGFAWTATHTYPSVSSNTTYTATVTFYTKSGTQTTTVKVVDGANTPPPASSVNTGGGLTNQPGGTYTPSQLPNGNSDNSGPGVPAGEPQ